MLLVTGAAGPVGKRVADRLRAQGEEVRVIEGPVLKARDLGQAMAGCRGVYHCEELFDFNNISPPFYDVNTGGTEKVLQAAVTAGVSRVLIMSSVVAAGPSQSLKRRDEKEEPMPLPAPLQHSKLLAENLGLRFAAEQELEVVIIRPSFIIGAGSHAAARWFSVFAKSRFRCTPSSGAYIYNFISADDVADGAIAAMEKGHSGEIYILAADEHYTLKDVLDLFARYSGLPPVRDFCIPMPLLILSSWFQKDSVLNTEMIENFLTWNWIFDNAKAKEALGFAPKEARRAWLETIIWAAENGYLPRKVARKVLDYALRQ